MIKVDGPRANWMVQEGSKRTVLKTKTGRSFEIKLDGLKTQNWTTISRNFTDKQNFT